MNLIFRTAVTISLLYILTLNMFASDMTPERKFAYKGFSGGMMLHTGYVSSGEFTITGQNFPARTIQVEGMPTGIGGAMRFHFGNHLRVGTEGYVSNLTYGEYENSRISVGWGGILADLFFEGEKFSPYFGVTVGGGRVRNTTIFSPTPEDFIMDEKVSYRSYSIFSVAPFVGVEYKLTPKMRLALKLDYLINASDYRPDFVRGPRIYIGFIFDRSK